MVSRLWPHTRLFLVLFRPTERFGNGSLQYQAHAHTHALLSEKFNPSKREGKSPQKKNILSPPPGSPPHVHTHLRKVNAKGVHIEAVEEAGEALAEAGEALVHELEVHHVGLEVGDGVGELGEGGLEGVQRERRRAVVVVVVGVVLLVSGAAVLRKLHK